MKKFLDGFQDRIPKKIQIFPKLPKIEFVPFEEIKSRISHHIPPLPILPLKEWKLLEKRLNEALNTNLKISATQKQQISKYYRRFREILSAPFIYSMIVPAIILHVFLEIFHQICFRLYGIPRVRALDYFKMKRVPVPLNIIEKTNCAYCSYFNGLISYAQEVAGRTEKYWCPIKHLESRAHTHRHYEDFTGCVKNRKDLKERWNQFKDMDDLK